MKNREEIVTNWLPRYTKTPLENFGEYILLCNFKHYLESFSKHYNVPICDSGEMQTVTAKNITMIRFGMGPSMAATVMDLLSAIKPKACLFLGKCGSLKEDIPTGSFLLPIGAIRAEGATNEYFDPAVPSLPSFQIHKAVSHVIADYKENYFTGVVYTTARRVWEHDEKIKERLVTMRATAVDMETATLFSVGFYNSIPTGALLLVSDLPMIPEGIKTEKSDKTLTEKYSLLHLKIGVDSLKRIMDSGEPLKHLQF